MSEVFTSGGGFGAMRLNGQVVHYKGLHDSYSVVTPGYVDGFTVSDAANQVIFTFVDTTDLTDAMIQNAIQAEAIEALSSEGGIYAYEDTITLTDAMIQNVIQADAIEMLSSEGGIYAYEDAITLTDSAAVT